MMPTMDSIRLKIRLEFFGKQQILEYIKLNKQKKK